MINRFPGFMRRPLYAVIKWYYSSPRRLTHRGISLVLLPSVFHPGHYLSTDILLDFVSKRDLESKKVLELGCGSGFISMYLAKNNGVRMHASDINKNAVKGLLQNTTSNKLEIEIFHSDLFDNVPKIDFDYILINPPYYAHKISKDNPDEYAFYAGENLEYFTKLFDQLISRINSKTEVLFVLSENAALKTINIEADKRGFQLETIHTATKGGEIFFIQELN